MASSDRTPWLVHIPGKDLIVYAQFYPEVTAHVSLKYGFVNGNVSAFQVDPEQAFVMVCNGIAVETVRAPGTFR